jgi:hypothetical protein
MMVVLHDYLTFQGLEISRWQQVSFVTKGHRGWLIRLIFCFIFTGNLSYVTHTLQR